MARGQISNTKIIGHKIHGKFQGKNWQLLYGEPDHVKAERVAAKEGLTNIKAYPIYKE